MSALLNKLKKGKVLVVGDVMLDKYLEGKAERLSPESPVPVLTPLGEESRLGGAANVALNVSSLGSKVKLLGVVGKDLSGEEIKDLLKENKLSNSFLTYIIRIRKTLNFRYTFFNLLNLIFSKRFISNQFIKSEY